MDDMKKKANTMDKAMAVLTVISALCFVIGSICIAATAIYVIVINIQGN